MNTSTKLSLEAVQSALNVNDFGINGMSNIGQILFPHLYHIKCVLEFKQNLDDIKQPTVLSGSSSETIC